jgi:hypothetical protein
VTNQQKHALQRIMESIKGVQTRGPSYDANFKRMDDGDPSDLHEDPRYRLGWERCAAHANMLLRFFLTATPQELIKYAGKVKKGGGK